MRLRRSWTAWITSRPLASRTTPHRIDNSRTGPYSDYLLKELDDEIFKHEPKYSAYIEILKHIGQNQFNLETFRAACATRSSLLTPEDTPSVILRALFSFSVIGYLQTGGGRGGSSYIWQYINARAQFDDSAVFFRVHPGFKEVLRLKLVGAEEAAQE